MRIAGMLVIVALSGATLAADSADVCDTISDDDARLACYDEQSRRQKAEREKPGSLEKESGLDNVESDAAAGAAAAESAGGSGEAIVTEKVIGTTEQDLLPEPTDVPAEPTVTPSDDDAKSFSAKIEKLVHRPQKDYIFFLDNDQVWIQQVYRMSNFREGDLVTLRRGRWGGYTLKNSRGVQTRVRRLQ